MHTVEPTQLPRSGRAKQMEHYWVDDALIDQKLRSTPPLLLSPITSLTPALGTHSRGPPAPAPPPVPAAGVKPLPATASGFTKLSGSIPLAIATTDSAESRQNSRNIRSENPPMCGVSTTFGRDVSGWPVGSGSCETTSNAAAAGPWFSSLRAAINASSSTTGPTAAALISLCWVSPQLAVCGTGTLLGFSS
jgi:hypothetical protein